MERLVILEEIKSFYDSPESLLFLHAMSSTFGKEHPLSSPILGTSESVASIASKDIKNYWFSFTNLPNLFLSSSDCPVVIIAIDSRANTDSILKS